MRFASDDPAVGWPGLPPAVEGGPCLLNGGCTYTEIVDPRGREWTLAAYLAARHRHTSEADWQERIDEGRVLVNGQRASAGQPLRAGWTIAWHRPPWEEPDVPLSYAVLHEDEQLLAVAKPSGLPTVPGGGFLEHTLLARVQLRDPAAAPVHRLGRGTSGIVLFARTGAAASALARAWREQRVTKVYRALVAGHPEQDAFTVTTPIGPVPHGALGLVHAASPGGKASRSDVRVLQRRERASLVEVCIETGRPHQIRIHMAACGHPLVGDPLYAPGGGFQPGEAARPGDTGYLLHARCLAFPHPATGQWFEVVCAPPAALTLA